MSVEIKRIQNVYLFLNVSIMLPIALIVGINTLFLLDGGLNNFQAFTANAFYTVGLLLFEIPTGMVADTWGRRRSVLIGLASQIVGAALYFLMWYLQAPFIGWAIVSVLLGLGYTFFSGALEAWLVDELKHAKFKGDYDPIFAKAQVVVGATMLLGTITGGLIAQFTSLGIPYLVRCIVQAVCLVLALMFMKEHSFTPQKVVKVSTQARQLLDASVKYGFHNRPVKMVMFSGLFLGGVLFYGFYAAQPLLLELFGDKQAIGVAGLGAAIITGTQIIGGLLVPSIRRLFRIRTNILIASSALTVVAFLGIGLITNFYIVLGLFVIWALAFAAGRPVRQAYLNALIPSKQRATVLSFDSMIDSTGGVVTQPALGRVADVYSYGASYVGASIIVLFSLPFLVAAKRERVKSDVIKLSELEQPV